MTAEIVPLPGAAAEPPKRKRRRVPQHVSEWIEVASKAENAGGTRGVLVYETADGSLGYECTLSVSPVHGKALLAEMLKLMEQKSYFELVVAEPDAS
jgi:hypothetical protein